MALAAVLLLACGAESSDVVSVAAGQPPATGQPLAGEQPAAKGKAVVPNANAAAVAAPAKPVYAYNPVGKRDPFRSYLLELRARGDGEKRTPPKKTERFELDQYRLTGIMSGTSQPRALVEDPSGEGHALHIGSPLGKNKGRVTRISSRQIIVVEQFRNAKGELMRVPITIKLPQDELSIEEQLR